MTVVDQNASCGVRTKRKPAEVGRFKRRFPLELH